MFLYVSLDSLDSIMIVIVVLMHTLFPSKGSRSQKNKRELVCEKRACKTCLPRVTLFQAVKYIYTVGPVVSRHLREQKKCPLNIVVRLWEVKEGRY